MSAVIIEGKAIGAAVRGEVGVRVAELVASGTTPGLGAILCGDDPASAVYVRNKGRAAAELGIHFDVRTPAADSSTADILAFDIEGFFRRIGLDQFLTTQRRTGMESMVNRIRSMAREIAGKWRLREQTLLLKALFQRIVDPFTRGPLRSRNHEPQGISSRVGHCGVPFELDSLRFLEQFVPFRRRMDCLTYPIAEYPILHEAERSRMWPACNVPSFHLRNLQGSAGHQGPTYQSCDGSRF